MQCNGQTKTFLLCVGKAQRNYSSEVQIQFTCHVGLYRLLERPTLRLMYVLSVFFCLVNGLLLSVQTTAIGLYCFHNRRQVLGATARRT